MLNNAYKIIVFIAAALLVNTSLTALDLPLSTELGLKGQLGVKLSHPETETFGKGLPLGPSSVRFFNGVLWVSDTLNSRLLSFNANNGSYIGEIVLKSTPKSNPGDFYFAKDQTGALKIWVCDEDNSSVSVFDSEGNCLKTLGSLEKDDFSCPCRIERLSNGNMLVFDWAGHEIIELTSELAVAARTKADARSMLINGDKLLYVTLNGNKTMLNTRNLKTGALASEAISLGTDAEPDILACCSDENIIFGSREVENEPAQYRLIKQPSLEGEAPYIAVAYPPAFAVRPLVADNQGNYYNLCLDTDSAQPVLKLLPLNLNFALKGSKG